MPLWKIAFLSYAVLRVVHTAQSLTTIIKIAGTASALRSLTCWRVYADAAFICGVILMASDIAVFTQTVWMLVFFLAVATAAYDLFIYPEQIKSEPNIDEKFLRKARLFSLVNWPIYAGLYIYAFASPHIWNRLAQQMLGADAWKPTGGTSVALGVLMRDVLSGAFFLVLGLCMLGTFIFGVISGEALFPARRGGLVMIEHAGQPILFWGILAFCALGGSVATVFGGRILRHQLTKNSSL